MTLRNIHVSAPCRRRKMHPTLYAFLVAPYDPDIDGDPLAFYAERAVLASLWYRTDKLAFRRTATTAQVHEAINDETAYISLELLIAATGLFRPSELAARIWEDATKIDEVLKRLRDAVQSCTSSVLVFPEYYS